MSQALHTPLESIEIVAECRPNIVVLGGILEIDAKLIGGTAVSALECQILDVEGQTRFVGLVPATGTGHSVYHASLDISHQIGPGHYEIAISLPGDRRAVLLAVTVIDSQAESRANLLREAFESRAAARQKLEGGEVEEAVRLLERAVSLYGEVGADAPAWQSTIDLGGLYLSQNNLERAKHVTLQALSLLGKLNYPPEALQRCDDQLADIEVRQQNAARDATLKSLVGFSKIPRERSSGR